MGTETKDTKKLDGANLKPNLTTGTKNTDNFSLKATDICRIIKQCKESGVENFQFQDLTIKFLPQRNEDAAKPGQASDQLPMVTEFSEADKQNIELMDQDAAFEAEEAQLLIDDPQGFERYQIDKHLERNRQANEKVEN